MTRREYVLERLHATADKASKIDGYFVLRFWISPFDTLECEASYFEDSCNCDKWFDIVLNDTKDYTKLPYCIYTSNNCEYDPEFVKLIDKELTDKNIQMLNWLK